MIAEAALSLFDGVAHQLSGIRNASLEDTNVSLTDPRSWEDLLSGTTSEAGLSVTHSTALQLAPVWQAVSLISGDIASMPLNLYRRLENEDREIAYDDNLNYLVSVQPNEETDAFEFWRRVMVHALLWQNSYVYIRRNGRLGEVLGLYNLLPDRTAPRRDTDTGQLYYETEVDGQMTPLWPEEVLHIKGLAVENDIALDLVAKARDSWGLALAAEHFNSKFFAHGAQAGGILEVPALMSPEAKKNLTEKFEQKYTTKSNWFRVMVLRDGAKFHSVTIKPEESQTHELREDQVREVARYFNLPPFKLGLSDSVSYNSAEQSQLIYVISTLLHWSSAIKAKCAMRLLSEQQRRSRSHFFDHNPSKLIELDAKTMAEVLEIERRNEIISANEWRRKINLNRRTDPGGDEYLNPNVKSASSLAPSKPVEEAHRILLTEAIDRMARRVSRDAQAKAKSQRKFVAWLDGRAHDHRAVFDEVLRPVVSAIVAHDGSDAESLLCGLHGRFFHCFLSRLSPLVEPPYLASQLVENVAEACQAFEATAADELIPLVFGRQRNAEAN